MNQRTKVITLVETAILAALAIVLNMFTPFHLWPNGGSVTLTMVPIAILAFRRGVIPGITAGLITGLILLVLPGAFYAHPIQVILDYPLAFALLGFSGWLSIKNTTKQSSQIIRVVIGLFSGGILRLVSHFLSGVIFFADYAPKGQSVYVYSLVYNASYILPEIIISIIVVIVLLYAAPKLFRP
ncbi:energy-coupled thiamine transporter ThiT [Shimazuella sp. AN120528]|uniref:energy-coupled thiamine transporter ThiT n=1 Tax=Shimazuella soli TaxID=1892854 RepID=UPI001F0F127D|nr:energy-coupled thiamine transporter ThiT [Shimazuella soli]MCH5584875.1 energy-coupled thiamine transporter ThiT [Shimazuella soli]